MHLSTFIAFLVASFECPSSLKCPQAAAARSQVEGVCLLGLRPPLPSDMMLAGIALHAGAGPAAPINGDWADCCDAATQVFKLQGTNTDTSTWAE